jgi:pyruvate-ferredoxin/flavodoxin oxidoreductase
MLANKGDLLPVSAFPPDGTWPTATTQWEKRNIAIDIPVWDEDLCIQCNKCALVCPHAAIRAKVYEPDQLRAPPRPSSPWTTRPRTSTARSTPSRWRRRTAPAAPSACGSARPRTRATPSTRRSTWRRRCRCASPRRELRVLPRPSRGRPHRRQADVKGSQFLQPLFEYSGACEGCGETPYVKLLTQLFGDRTLIGNATGCSSIYGGNLPTTPYADANGRGPAWNNSLFEDNAEFSFGFRLAVDQTRERTRPSSLKELAEPIGRHSWTS